MSVIKYLRRPKSPRTSAPRAVSSPVSRYGPPRPIPSKPATQVQHPQKQSPTRPLFEDRLSYPSLSFSLAVSHCPWLPDRVTNMKLVRPTIVRAGTLYREITDRAPNNIWSRTMWHWGASQPVSHGVYLQDDLRIHPEFWAIVEAMVRAVPNRVIALISNHPMSEIALSAGHSWFRMCETLGAGYIIPTVLMGSFLDWLNNISAKDFAETNEDFLITRWQFETGRKAWCPIPSIIQTQNDRIFTTNEAYAQYPYRRSYITWDDPRVAERKIPGVTSDLRDPDYWRPKTLPPDFGPCVMFDSRVPGRSVFAAPGEATSGRNTDYAMVQEAHRNRVRRESEPRRTAPGAARLPYWTPEVASTIRSDRFRDQYVDQGGEYPYRGMVDWLRSVNRGNWLDVVKEDAAFGCKPVVIDGYAVSRDLLDSCAEIHFLVDHCGLSLSEARVLDIGAGYGRFAHRLATLLPKSFVYCTDAIEVSMRVCEKYLTFRGVDRALVVPPDRIHETGAIDLATNIHSWSECTRPDVAGWLDKLVAMNVRRLFIVPHKNPPDHLRTWNSVTGTHDGPTYRPELESRGFRLVREWAGPECQAPCGTAAGAYMLWECA